MSLTGIIFFKKNYHHKWRTAGGIDLRIHILVNVRNNLQICEKPAKYYKAMVILKSSNSLTCIPCKDTLDRVWLQPYPYICSMFQKRWYAFQNGYPLACLGAMWHTKCILRPGLVLCFTQIPWWRIGWRLGKMMKTNVVAFVKVAMRTSTGDRWQSSSWHVRELYLRNMDQNSITELY